jgi:glycogen debranching enzyme
VTATPAYGDTSTTLDPGGLVTTLEGSTFCLSGRTGDVAGEPQGLFFLDARLTSRFTLRIDGEPLECLSVAADVPYHTTFVLRESRRSSRPPEDLLVLRRRWVGQGMREDVELRNHGRTPITARVEIDAEADFADLFVVKAGGPTAPTPGMLTRTWGDGSLRFGFVRGTEERGMVVAADRPGEAYPGRLCWDATVPPGGMWRTTLTVTVLVEGVPVPLTHPAGQPVERSTTALARALWRTRITRLRTADENLAAVLDQSVEDLGALLMADPEYPDVPVVAAGAPWYMTLFGRDALITAWSALPVYPELAVGVLETLARLQGRRDDPATGEQPGRIVHEVRLADSPSRRFAEADLYYGTVDAPALFVMLLGEVHRWGVDPDRVRALLPAADACLGWMERVGDADGFVSYTHSPADDRLRNQGWKDSHDGILFADGASPVPPIALCEVQAYRYAAHLARAELADDPGLAGRHRARAMVLRRSFQRRFWLPDEGWYALALDGQRRPVDALASNMAHALWGGIVSPEHARLVADHLTAAPLFSGWGLRTLAAGMAAYNPVSYHNGSVWPHDTALAVAGLARYGLMDAARQVAEALLDAAQHHENRLPELFAGLGRGDVSVPVSYPSSCSPQAWAAVAPLLLLRSLLRLDPDVPAGHVRVAPSVPGRWLPLRLEGLRIGGAETVLGVDGCGRVSMSGLPDGVVLVGAERSRARRP